MFSKEKPCILFGAAKIGLEFYKCMKPNAIYFFDNDPNKWGMRFEGVECIEPHYIEDVDVVVVNDKHDIDMVVQLMDLGYKHFYTIYLKGAPGEEREFGVDEFDYSDYDSFEIKNNKVALLSRYNSGCNSHCFKYVIDKYYDTQLDLVLLDLYHKDPDYYYDIFTSKFIVFTASFTRLQNRIVVQCYHSFTIKGIGYFDPGISESSFEITHNDMLNTKYVLSYSKLYNLTFGASLGVPKSRFVITGVPRNDVLLLSEGKKNLCSIFPELINKRIILYMPTFRERILYSDAESEGYIFDYPDFDIEDLNTFLKQNDSVFVVKMHIGDTKRFSNLFGRHENIIYIKDEDYAGHDFYEFINGTDLLITDYSSVYVDYLLIDKPIIFAHRDIDKYEEERGIIWEPVDFWFPGARVSRYEQLKAELMNVIDGKDDYLEKRHVIRDIMHKNQDSNASKRLLDLLEGEFGKL